MGHVVLVTSTQLFVATNSHIYIFVFPKKFQIFSSSHHQHQNCVLRSSVPCLPSLVFQVIASVLLSRHVVLMLRDDPQHSVQLNQWELLRCSFWVCRLGVDLKVCVEVVLVTLRLLLCGSYLYNKVVEFSYLSCL